MNIQKRLLTYINIIFNEDDDNVWTLNRFDEVDNDLKNRNWCDKTWSFFNTESNSVVFYYLLKSFHKHRLDITKDKKIDNSFATADGGSLSTAHPVRVETITACRAVSRINRRPRRQGGNDLVKLTIFYSCLFLTYSYALPEISYPIACFLLDTKKTVKASLKKRLIQASIELCNLSSKGLLQLNTDLSFYEKIRNELINQPDEPVSASDETEVLV